VASSPIPIAVQWTDTLAPPTPRQGGEPCTRCCVTCQGVTLCGCRIVLDCGRCCCTDTCNCDDINGRPAMTAAAVIKQGP
jgi:hypothetical protein